MMIKIGLNDIKSSLTTIDRAQSSGKEEPKSNYSKVDARRFKQPLFLGYTVDNPIVILLSPPNEAPQR